MGRPVPPVLLAFSAARMKALGPEWRHWLAENIALGIPPAQLIQILVDHGNPQPMALAEVNAAMARPRQPAQGDRRLVNRLAKRDWVLDSQARLRRLAPGTVPRKHKLSEDDFLRDHYSANMPVVITGMLDGCPAMERWSLASFAERFPDRTVEVQFGREADREYEMNSVAHKRSMPFGEYAKMVLGAEATNDFYMTANNDSKNRHALAELWDETPRLPEYLDGAKSGFLWLGPRGTITPFHHDLTNNFMAQIIGSKRVRLVSPMEINSLDNKRHCFTEVDGRDDAIDLARFPKMAGVPILDCVLNPGEILFLPVGWWHHVEGLSISATIAFTNFKWDNDFHTAYPPGHDF